MEEGWISEMGVWTFQGEMSLNRNVAGHASRFPRVESPSYSALREKMDAAICRRLHDQLSISFPVISPDRNLFSEKRNRRI